MFAPDLKGSQGTFCFCTTRSSGHKFREGGVRIPIERNGSALHSYIPGPEDPLAGGSGRELRFDLEIHPNGTKDRACITVGSGSFTLKVGEYSEWIPVKFKAGLGFTARGICRFYVKELSPEVEVYVTPVNIDPGRPDLPVSHPVTYSIYLSKLFGPYATLGLAEDTWALNEEVLDDQAFLAQCYSNHDDRERMLFDALEKTRQGLCACVFDTTDRVQHMVWLYLDLRGRERQGIVEPGDKAEVLKKELREKLDGLVDPASGRVGITGVFDCDATYAGPYVDNAPDLIVGYGDGFRASWDSVMGKVTTKIFEDNLKAWSGDHCIDPRLVPGVLFSNFKIADEKPAIVDVAPTVLKLFGLGLPIHLDGKPWTVATDITR